MPMPKNTTYADAGVDIEAGNTLIDRIKPYAKATSRLGAATDLGGFGGLFDLKQINMQDPILVSATDGVGTKLRIAIDSENHKNVGIDLVAMCVNDLIVQGAEPLFFLDYFATGSLDLDVTTEVIKSIAEGCKLAHCALIGGETAEMPGMYEKGDYDLAGFAVGAVERTKLLPSKDIQPGDHMIGLASSGVHSNGFSLVRKILKDNHLNFQDRAPYTQKDTFAQNLLTPTKIYVKSIISALKEKQLPIKALAHITGGGLTENIPRILSDNLQAKIDLSAIEYLPVFQWLQEKGHIHQSEMLRTFNCGIGMAVIVPEAKSAEILTHFEAMGEKACHLGVIEHRTNANTPQVVYQSELKA